MAATAGASDCFQRSYNFLDLHKAFIILKAVIFDDSLYFLQCLIAFPFYNFCYTKIRVLQNDPYFPIHQRMR